MAILDEMRGELAAQRAIHGRGPGTRYEFTVSEDILPLMKAEILAKYPDDPQLQEGGIPLIHSWGIPVTIDVTLPPNTIRVDWSWPR